MLAKKQDNKIIITFRYNPFMVSFIKSLDGRKYIPGTKQWTLPIANSALSLKRLAERGFAIDPELLEAVKADENSANEAEALAVMSDTDFPDTLPLYNYQRVGASFLYKIGSGILGDEPGAGKTLMSLAVVEKRKSRKVLVFCPAVLKHQWAGEVRKFLPGHKVIVIEGTQKKREELWKQEARFYICNYELLLRDFNSMNKDWDYIIADEATKISNPSAKQSRIIKKLKSQYRLAMSGTPIANFAQNVWNLVDFCQPGAFGDYWNFLTRYCLKNQFGGIYGYQNLDELRLKLKRYMIRRLKKDVLPELPERIEIDVPFVLSDEEKELQKKIKMEILYEINDMDINKLKMPQTLQFTIVKFGRLRQLADSLELLGGNKKSSKMETLKELLMQFNGTSQKILIFSEFSEMCKILYRELVSYNPVMIIGEVPNEKRQVILDEFNSNPASRICILSSAGQYGLNITSAEIVINYDLPFSLSKLEQRIGRAHRIGQKHNVMVYNLLGQATADMAIKKVIYRKSQLSGHLLGDIPITIEDVKEMLSE